MFTVNVSRLASNLKLTFIERLNSGFTGVKRQYWEYKIEVAPSFHVAGVISSLLYCIWKVAVSADTRLLNIPDKN